MSTDTLSTMVDDCRVGWPTLDWMLDGPRASGALSLSEGMELRADVTLSHTMGYEGRLTLTVRMRPTIRAAAVRVEFGHTKADGAEGVAAALEGVAQAAPALIASIMGEAVDRMLGNAAAVQAAIGGAS